MFRDQGPLVIFMSDLASLESSNRDAVGWTLMESNVHDIAPTDSQGGPEVFNAVFKEARKGWKISGAVIWVEDGRELDGWETMEKEDDQGWIGVFVGVSIAAGFHLGLLSSYCLL